MKMLWIMTALVFCLLVMQQEGHAGKTSELMYRVYIESAANPDTFDEYIAKNTKIFDKDFFACAEKHILTYGPIAQERAAYCRAFPDPQLQQQCLADNPAANFGAWMISIAAAVNKKTLWCDTFSGSFGCFGKSLMEALVPGFWEAMIRESGQTVRPYFRCD